MKNESDIIGIKTISQRKRDNIRLLCRRYDIPKYKINKDYSIDVFGDVNLSGRGLQNIPLHFNIVYGKFNISNNHLRHLDRAPIECKSFDCSSNKINILESDMICEDNFIISYNEIAEVRKFPKADRVYISFNKLEYIDYDDNLTLFGNPLFDIKNPKHILSTTDTTPIRKLISLIRNQYYDYTGEFGKTTNQNTLERINEFEIIDHKSFYISRLEQLYDFLEIPFYEDELIDKISSIGYNII